MTGTITGSNNSCCGDDGLSDNFSNATHTCIEGSMSLIDFDVIKSFCEISDYKWFSGTVTGNNGQCCGDDEELDNFYNGSISNTSYFCLNGSESFQSIDSNESICSQYNYGWITDAAKAVTSFHSGGDVLIFDIGFINSDSSLDIAVGNSNPAGFSTYINFGNGTFTNRTFYSTDSIDNILIKDLNNDSFYDIIISLYGGGFSVYLNDGNGLMVNSTYYSTGYRSFSFNAADIDNDGDIDLALPNYGSDSFSLFFNYGNGTLTNKTDYSGFSNIETTYLGLLNNDSYYDIVVLGYFSHRTRIMFNMGNGTFTNFTEYNTFYTRQLDISDIDNDSDNDIVMCGGSSMHKLVNNGLGGFSDSSFSGMSCSHLILRDYDNDSDKDVLMTVDSDGHNYTYIMKNNGAGTFDTVELPEFVTRLRDVDVGDFNSDSMNDLIVGSYNTGRMYIQIYSSEDNFSCCGDDSNEYFSNSTHSCCAGVFKSGSC